MKPSRLRAAALLLVILAAVPCIALLPAPTAAQDGKPALSVEIACPTVGSARTLPLGRAFPVVIANVSDRPVRLWSEGCSWGYGQVRIEFREPGGETWVFEKKPRSWRRNRPILWNLGPGEPLVLQVNLTDDAWAGPVPLESLRGRTCTVRALLVSDEKKTRGGFARIEGDDGPPSQSPPPGRDAWTGRIASHARTYHVK